MNRWTSHEAAVEAGQFTTKEMTRTLSNQPVTAKTHRRDPTLFERRGLSLPREEVVVLSHSHLAEGESGPQLVHLSHQDSEVMGGHLAESSVYCKITVEEP